MAGSRQSGHPTKTMLCGTAGGRKFFGAGMITPPGTLGLDVLPPPSAPRGCSAVCEGTDDSVEEDHHGEEFDSVEELESVEEVGVAAGGSCMVVVVWSW